MSDDESDGTDRQELFLTAVMSCVRSQHRQFSHHNGSDFSLQASISS
jgi:hypothetical protein